MSFHDTSNTGLGLGLGLGLGFVSFHDQPESCMKSDDHPLLRESLKMIKKVAENPSKCNKTYPSLTLGPPDDDNDGDDDDDEVNNNNNDQPSSKTDESYEYLHPGQVSSHSAVSSFSNSSSIKRERDIQVLGEEFEVEIEKVPTRVDDVVDEDGNTRKKLRLTKEQAAVLEENFRDHSTLNSKQKQELAMKLNLRTRQVEVWFQNRRARTKLKQTESDCEVLKKCCDTLTEENKRLQKELHELKSMQLATTPVPLYMQIPAAATLSICPSCERICGANNNNVNSDNSNNNGSSHTTTLLIGSKAHHHPFYKSSNNYPFPHSSSAAC